MDADASEHDSHLVGIKKTKNSLACKLCSMLKDAEDFDENGCENCNDVLESIEEQYVSSDMATSNFEGVIALLKPNESWVARYQSISNFRPGLYAVAVYERPPRELVARLQSKGRSWRNRDGKER